MLLHLEFSPTALLAEVLEEGPSFAALEVSLQVVVLVAGLLAEALGAILQALGVNLPLEVSELIPEAEALGASLQVVVSVVYRWTVRASERFPCVDGIYLLKDDDWFLFFLVPLKQKSITMVFHNLILILKNLGTYQNCNCVNNHMSTEPR